MKRRLRSVNPWVVDIVIAIALALLALYDWSFSRDPLWRLPLQLLIAVSVLARRRAPLVAVGVTVGAAVALRVSPGPEGYLAFIVNSYSVGRHTSSRWRSLAVLMSITAIGSSVRSDVTVVLLALIAWLVGDVLRERSWGVAAALEAAERGADAERARIARELHDVIAHGVAVMVVQAEGAKNLIGRDPVRALNAIETISATGREAMAELRQLLKVLGPQGDAPSVEPASGLREIDVLVERVRTAGQPVELFVNGDATRVPATAGLAAFRVVQEGLTNAVKHAPGAATQVRIVFGEELEIEVRDVGTPERPDQVAGAGRGLAGLSERIRLLGGRLTAGATEAGGFALRATIPLQPAVS